MSLLDEALASAAEEVTPYVDVDVELGGKILPLRFYREDGMKWAEITAYCPPRLRSPLDKNYGYNYQAAARLAAPSTGRLLEVDTVDNAEEQTPGEQLPDEKWDELFAALTGKHVEMICSAVWQVNAYDAQERLAAAKKALARDSKRKSA